ncbi:two-component response regulator-like APRR9 isoform X2 [Humulus lupulus]|uniref:two-component response regulator-like APRR9 isoform X2 n=1 Tax=Humulus lupulus TaxID=3486 RepID=UPI002B414DEE|nr:two-component response regulator-like APRR9 isoform X2 [Humulus lupulus]
MYGNYSNPFPRAADPHVEWAFHGVPYHPQLEEVPEQPLVLEAGVSNSSSSGCSSYSSPSSLGSAGAQRPSIIQRSVSSHSLQKSGTHRVLSSVAELLIDSQSQTSPVRRVYSTGDLQRINMMQHSYRSSAESPISSESNAIIEGMSKACRYSPEEKKERIERYRSKRNQRNFNKKIKYACRKTLADSRPRIRGRFARNEEIIERNSDQIAQDEWSHINGIEEEDQYNEDDDENWINLLDAFSSNLIPN